MTVFILGATGMLGQAVARELLMAGSDVVQISRSSLVEWDFFRSDFKSLASQVGMTESDFLVNCIGWIPQKSSGIAEKDEVDAHELNVELVRQIHDSQQILDFGWIQIVTDCVFSGKSGPYGENSPFDPEDLYGTTKAEGESIMDGAMRIRSSIIGPDPVHRSGLFEWFKKQPPSSRVQGFANHFWNGVSTKAFGRLVAGLTTADRVSSGLYHWIPADSLSKLELLKLFRAELGRLDISIEDYLTDQQVNRVLATNNAAMTSLLWEVAGYKNIPTVEELVKEFIREDLGVSR